MGGGLLEVGGLFDFWRLTGGLLNREREGVGGWGEDLMVEA